MTFMLRDRPDGMVEIVISKPVLVGIFPDRDIATRVRAFLEADGPEVPELAVSGFATAAADVAEAEAEALAQAEAALAEPPRFERRRTTLPAVIERPKAPAILAPEPARLTDAQKARAFDRIMTGEKIASVAADFGISFTALRGMWANHKRQLQAHLAEGGQQPCALCQKPFTPSISHPETCARCSHG
jgi:hypothetical protein